MRERYVVINGSINGKELSVSKKKNPERKLQTETHAVIGKAVRDFQNNRRTRKMIVNRGWQESITTKEEMQAVNRNVNEQKKQTIETLRQTIKEWDISGRIGETVSRIKIDTYN